MTLILPPALLKNGRIGVCSPAWYVPGDTLNLAREHWESLGYSVYLHPQTQLVDGDLAGDPILRAQALHDLFLDDSIDAIVLANGGYGCIQILEYLDFDLIKKNPKIVIGYSDLTLILLAIYSQTGIVTFHGPSFRSFADDLLWHPITIKSMQDVLSGETPIYKFTSQIDSVNVIRSGEAKGPILGGNHVRMKDLTGTKFIPSMEECIFFTESNRPSYPDFDGNIRHFRLSQTLEKPRAILLGEMELVNSQNPKYQDKCYNLNPSDILPNLFPDIPIVSQMPFSHCRSYFLTFPLGVEFSLQASKNGKVCLQQLEPAVN